MKQEEDKEDMFMSLILLLVFDICNDTREREIGFLFLNMLGCVIHTI